MILILNWARFGFVFKITLSNALIYLHNEYLINNIAFFDYYFITRFVFLQMFYRNICKFYISYHGLHLYHGTLFAFGLQM